MVRKRRKNSFFCERLSLNKWPLIWADRQCAISCNLRTSNNVCYKTNGVHWLRPTNIVINLDEDCIFIIFCQRKWQFINNNMWQFLTFIIVPKSWWYGLIYHEYNENYFKSLLNCFRSFLETFLSHLVQIILRMSVWNSLFVTFI